MVGMLDPASGCREHCRWFSFLLHSPGLLSPLDPVPALGYGGMRGSVDEGGQPLSQHLPFPLLSPPSLSHEKTLINASQHVALPGAL